MLHRLFEMLHQLSGMLHQLSGILRQLGQSVAPKRYLIPLKVAITRHYLTDKKQ